MSAEPITRWIHELKAGRESAATCLWDHYYLRLVDVARRKLRGLPQQLADEEDIAARAIYSLFRRARDGQFAQLHHRDELWGLLVMIAERKTLNAFRDQRRLKRGGGQVSGDSAFFQASQLNRERQGLDLTPGKELAPDVQAAMQEAFDDLLGLLEGELREIALSRMEGYSNDEIAKQINRSRPTVERRLKLIREIWRQEGVSGENQAPMTDASVKR